MLPRCRSSAARSHPGPLARLAKLAPLTHSQRRAQEPLAFVSLAQPIRRGYSQPSEAAADPEAESALREAKIRSVLEKGLKPHELLIEDVSGGCGSFFRISVASDAFAGKTKVAQHRMVNELLKDQLKSMHGITLSTSVPKKPA